MFWGDFNKTIIALVGYEMVITNSALSTSLAIYHLIFNARSCNNFNCMLIIKLNPRDLIASFLVAILPYAVYFLLSKVGNFKA